MRKRKDRDDVGLAAVFAAVETLDWLADQLAISQQAVSAWRRVPVEHCRRIEQLTGIPLHIQRPDIYHAADTVSASSQSALVLSSQNC